MNLDTLATISLVLAALPAALFLLNLLVYRSPRPGSALREFQPNPETHRAGALVGANSAPGGPSQAGNAVSVLIPARDEEQNIKTTVEAALANRGVELEVIVLDDHSTDRTAAIVSELARRDPRLRLESAPPLPTGWCGKQHACHVLARLATYPWLVFIDADVRLAPDALARMADVMRQTGADLASGVPHQELGTFSERLLIPLIHFVLLGFLPMHAMRRTKSPAFSAGCGQLFFAKRAAYRSCRGHAQIRGSLHDGIKLPRVFRRAGLCTDLFDATTIASCRMYRTNAAVWQGLGKNATEGRAHPAAIGPMSALLFGGQVLPFVLLAFAPALSGAGLVRAALAVGLAYVPRLAAVLRFRQPVFEALLHPVGVLALLSIQWLALLRLLAGRPAVWKNRSYPSASQPREPLNPSVPVGKVPR